MRQPSCNYWNSFFIHWFIQSINTYVLNAYVPGSVLGVGDIEVNKAKPLPSWSLHASGDRQTISAGGQNEAVLWGELIFAGEYDITYRVGWKVSSDTTTFGQTPEGNKGQSHENTWRSSIPHRKDRKCKGLEKEACSMLSRTGRTLAEPSGPGSEWSQKWSGGKVPGSTVKVWLAIVVGLMKGIGKLWREKKQHLSFFLRGTLRLEGRSWEQGWRQSPVRSIFQ